MSRTNKSKKRLISPDPVYSDYLLAKIINKVMKSGKKSIAQKQIYKAIDIIKQKTKEDPLMVIRQAIDNIKPNMEVRSRRVGGAAYQVPIPVRSDRRESLAICWLIQAARQRADSQYHCFYEKLAAEVGDAYKNQGGAINRKIQVHKMAEANKAFAHFRW